MENGSRASRDPFFMWQEMSRADFFEITTKASCEAALMDERHVHVEISNFVMHTFVMRREMPAQQ